MQALVAFMERGKPIEKCGCIVSDPVAGLRHRTPDVPGQHLHSGERQASPAVVMAPRRRKRPRQLAHRKDVLRPQSRQNGAPRRIGKGCKSAARERPPA